MILLLVASNRGVTVLPDWVLREVNVSQDYITRPITKGGLTRRMYAATRSDDTTKPFISHLLKLARSEPVKLQRKVAAGKDA